MYITYKKKKQVNKDTFIQDLEIILILHNTLYARNVAEIFQLAKSYRIKEIIITGDSANPPFGKDLSKASQSEEKKVTWSIQPDILKVITDLKRKKFKLISIDYAEESKSLFDSSFNDAKIALIIGNESTGLSREIISKLNNTYYIPNNLNSGVLSTNLSTAIALSMIIFKNKK